MRAIIHPGMHKTGTSSIQDTFKKADLGHIHYLDWRAANHSGMFALLFREPVEEYHAFKGNGVSRDQLLAERAEWRRRLLDQLQSGEFDSVMISAEDISSSDTESVERLAETIAPYCSDVQVIAYVRTPAGFMQSAFQQRVKGGGLNRLGPASLWPNYRSRFEKLDQVFGRENVKLKKFAPDRLVDGDVVRDLASELGIEIKDADIVRSNESISLEALALLFAQRRLGEGFVSGFPGAQRSNARFVAAISTLGSGRLRFSPRLVDPVIARNRADLDWMEQRLGESLDDGRDADDPLAISSEDDLLRIAEENREKLDRLLIGIIRSKGQDPQAGLVRNLELLRKLHY